MARAHESRNYLHAALLLAATGTGCGGQPTEYFGTTSRSSGVDDATFYVNNGNEPEYVDPGMAHDSASTTLILQMFEGLTTYAHGDMHPVQAGAVSWDQSDDNRFFRFHLRPEARWSDGKSVTARDYAYAWKRALRPALASQAASALYSVKNAELYNLSKLKVVNADVALRAGPTEGAPEAARLTKGTAVVVLATSPMKVQTGVAPLADVAGVKSVEHAKATDNAAEELQLGPSRPAATAAPGSDWKGAEVAVLKEGPPVDCDGSPDHFYLVERGPVRGYLPGCVLGPSKGKGGYALVRRYDDLPTFRPMSAPRPVAADALTGFVLAEDLVADDGVVGVRATDDLTLEVELERPTPYFLDLTSHTTLFPVREDVVEAQGQRGDPEGWTKPENIVVNGAYTLDDWRFRYAITMKQNPFYYDRDKLRIHRIVFTEVENYHATMNLYKAGDLDYLGDTASLPNEYVPFLKTKKDFTRSFYLSTYWYELNTRKPPTDDVRVRRALNVAIDKQQIVEKVTQGGQLAATHYVPDFVGLGYADAAAADKAAGTDPFSSPDVVFNPELGRDLLRQAGFSVEKDGDQYRAVGFPPLEILYNTSEGHRAIAIAIQDMWKRHLGVSATLRNEEWKVMLKNVRDGNFHVARFGWVGDYNHAHTWLDTFLSFSPNNRTGWVDKQFDDTLRLAAATADPKDSIKRYREAEKIAVDAMPKIPLYFYTKQALMKPWVRGFLPNPRNIQLIKWLWIEPSRHEMPTDTAPAYPFVEFPPPGRLVPSGEAP